MDLLDLFESIDLGMIDYFIRDKTQEDLQLDFKAFPDGKLTKEHRKILGKAISGFANSSGGLIIWGVDARKVDNVDCASKKIPIQSLGAFLSWLNTNTGKASSPIVPGIQHKIIDIGSDEGYAVTFVPESLSGPHMAKFSENRYFKRSGDSFYQMEHFDIADMFGRRMRPDLQLSAEIQIEHFRRGPQLVECRLIVILSAQNIGRGSAKAPYLNVFVEEPFSIYPYGIDGNRKFGLPELTSARGSSGRSYGSNSEFIIHPNTELPITAINRDLAGNKEGWNDPGELRVSYTLAAEGMPSVVAELRIPSKDLMSKLPDPS